MAAKAHLVGSLAFSDAESAMRAVGKIGGKRIDWIPDGETGSRRKWLARHRERMMSVGGLESKGAGVDADISPDRLAFGLRRGAVLSDLKLSTFGYSAAALESYEIYRRLKEQGELAAESRFMVALPTPLAMLNSFIAPAECATLEPVIQAAFARDVQQIVDAIPHRELALQWDVAIEFMILSGVTPTWFDDPYVGIVERLIGLADLVPAQVPLAYHLCYGSPYDTHFNEPEDAGLMVRVSNDMLGGVLRSVERLHMPVPIERTDAEFYAPLGHLRLETTELYLGLLHHEDGLTGARRRITAAKHVVDGFGVGCECGTGRTPADREALLKLHVDASEIADQPLDASVEVPVRLGVRSGPDVDQINAALRTFAERIPCSVCGAAIGSPCVEGSQSITRPHLDRYNDVMLRVAAGESVA